MKLLRLIIFATFVFATVKNGLAADPFVQGVEFSHAGQFPEAAVAFEKSAQAVPAAGTLVNLGLAEWQRGHAGAAILALSARSAIWLSEPLCSSRWSLNGSRTNVACLGGGAAGSSRMSVTFLAVKM